MPRGDQVARFYTLVMDLAQARHGFPAEMLARKHDWNVRTVYRDFHALERAGFPIYTDHGKWRLTEGWKATLPFPISLEERLALAVARDLIRPLAGAPLGRAFERLHERIAGRGGPAAGSAAQGELFRRVQRYVSTPSLAAIDYSAHRAILETLCRACEQRRTVRAVYYVLGRDELTRREIDPYHVHYDPRLEALYLFGWCHLRKAVRTFALHRFRQAALTRRGFEMPPSFTPEGYLKGAFRIWRAQNAIRVRLLVDPPAAGWVAERRWHTSQKLHRGKDGRCELALTVDGTPELARFILQMGAAVEVLEPASLRKEIAREHEKAARRGLRPPRETLTPDDRAPGDTDAAS